MLRHFGMEAVEIPLQVLFCDNLQICVEDRQKQVDLDNLLVWIVVGRMEDALCNL